MMGAVGGRDVELPLASDSWFDINLIWIPYFHARDVGDISSMEIRHPYQMASLLHVDFNLCHVDEESGSFLPWELCPWGWGWGPSIVEGLCLLGKLGRHSQTAQGTWSRVGVQRDRGDCKLLN